MTTNRQVRPFHLAVPDDQLAELHDRLDRTRWPADQPDPGWAYGIPSDHLRELVAYWRHDYDWPAAQARLNAWPQFTTEIDGTTIHFAHLRSPEPNATPLLITHGWPGSIVEFTRIAGPSTDPRAPGGDPADAFDLVLPHIPGFALSGPTREKGWEQHRVAAAFAELMARLGYERYGVQGGDWGALISRELGRAHPEGVIGVHLNLLPQAHALSEPTAAELATLDPEERARTLAPWRPGSAPSGGSRTARATPNCRRPARRPSPTPSPTPRSDSSTGSRRSSRSGASPATTSTATCC
ncbi:MAG TPA: epoxide hydrolase [Pseudonocardiaceae bacterium]|nr:epoxide hydrolase [Pseudonocardiaceae bacterium]